MTLRNFPDGGSIKFIQFDASHGKFPLDGSFSKNAPYKQKIILPPSGKFRSVVLAGNLNAYQCAKKNFDCIFEILALLSVFLIKQACTVDVAFWA